MTDAGDRYIRESLCTRVPHFGVAREAFFVTGRLASARCAAEGIDARLGTPHAGLEAPSASAAAASFKVASKVKRP